MSALIQQAYRWVALSKHFIGAWLAICLVVMSQIAFAAEQVTYYHLDALGSPIAATDESGNVLWKEAYRPYGDRIRQEDGGTNDIWYTGKPHEEEMGLTYFGARWYDPTVGRFMAMDPVGVKDDDIHSFNRYAYAKNNPYKYIDPDGRDAVTAFGGLLYETGQFLSGNGFNGSMVMGALVDGYNGQGDGLAAAVINDATSFIPAGALAGGLVKLSRLAKFTKGAGKKADDVIQVTKDGVALPAKPKYKIPENYVQNPHRSGSYGEIVNGKFKERLRIDPPTQPGKKGPNYSHYHKNGKGTHYSPRPGDPDPGF